jgi:hypothetical protein
MSDDRPTGPPPLPPKYQVPAPPPPVPPAGGPAFSHTPPPLPPGWSTPSAPTAPPAPPKRSGALTWVLVAGLLVLGLVVVGLVAAVVVIGADGAELTVDECRIEADGRLVAAGTVRADGPEVTVGVSFVDADRGTEVDEGEAVVDTRPGTAGWEATGSAPAAVQRVTCTARVVGS